MGMMTEEIQLSVQLEQYREQYGNDVFLLACYASFPLTLTSDLVYCLRENFLPEADWYTSPLFFMSGVVESIQLDLYEIEAPLRREFLLALRVHRGVGFKAELERLEAFMATYVRHRLGQGLQTAGRLIGLGEEMRWMSLACLNPGDVKDAIEQYLKRVAQMDDARERVRLATVLDSYAALLETEGMSFTLIRWADCVERGEPIGTDDPIEDWFEAQGILLKALAFDAIELVPESELESEAQDVLKTLSFQTIKVNDRGKIIDRPECSVTYFDEAIADGVSIRMIAIPSGEFMMGSPEGKGYDSEYPQHLVQVPPFFMSETPVTQKQWRTVVEQYEAIAATDLNPSPSHFEGEDRPVENVSWHDVTKFCQAISAVTRRAGYRLPTEAEWEYACRAGSTTDYACGNALTKEMAHFDSSSTTKVKQNRKPNAFGLYDMHGNVWEWCEDTWHKNYEGALTDGSAWIGNEQLRILRGCSWVNFPRDCRSAARNRWAPGVWNSYCGFRLVLSLPRNS